MFSLRLTRKKILSTAQIIQPTLVLPSHIHALDPLLLGKEIAHHRLPQVLLHFKRKPGMSAFRKQQTDLHSEEFSK
jgi:hypothetical protein